MGGREGGGEGREGAEGQGGVKGEGSRKRVSTRSSLRLYLYGGQQCSSC